MEFPRCPCEPNAEENTMPILLWLLGVPISLILVLMLLGIG
jgi:hypothetical protein